MASLDKAKFEAAFSRFKAPKDAESTEEDPRVQELWTLLEPALEERSRFDAEIRNHLGHVGKHLSECTADIISWRNGRGFAVAFAVAIVSLVVILLGAALFLPASNLSIRNLGSDSVRIAFIGGCFAILFGLPALILKGAFNSAQKDDTEGLLPEGAKVVVQSLMDITKGK